MRPGTVTLRNRLLLGIVGLLALGAVLDGTVHRMHAGQQTIGRSRAVVAVIDGTERDRTVATLVGTAGRPEDRKGGRSVYLAVREVAPGATIVLDDDIGIRSPTRLFLGTIGGAAAVQSRDLSGLEVPDTPATVQGAVARSPWILRVADGPVSTLLVVRIDGVAHLIDARLLPASSARFDIDATPPVPVEDATSARSADRPPSLARAVSVDVAVLLLLLLAGGLLLPRSLVHSSTGGGHRVALSLIVGIALQATLGLLLLPGLWGLGATLVTATVCGLLLRRSGNAIGWHRADVPLLVGATVVVAVIAAWARWSTFLLITSDSRTYWAGGAALADGTFDAGLLEVKRGFFLQPLHAIGFALGAEGLQALGAVLLVAAAVLLLTTIVADRPSRPALLQLRRAAPAIVAAALMAGTLIASPQVRTMAAYLNTHLLVAVLLMTLLLLLGSGQVPAARAPLLPAVAVVITAIVMSRPEGAVLAGLVLLGTLAVAEERPVWPTAWIALGLGTLVWSGLLIVGSRSEGQGIPRALLLLLLSGLVALAVPVVIRWLPPAGRRAIPVFTGAVLWVVALLLLVPGVPGTEDVRFLEVVVANLGRGAGFWGVIAVLLILGAILVVGLGDRGDVRTAPGRWFLIGFVPITLVGRLGDGLQRSGADWTLLLSGGGRVGWPDSVNRMWTHAVLVVLLLLLLQIRDRSLPTDEADGAQAGPASSSGVRPRPVMLGLLALTAIWVAAQWQPDHLPRPTDERVTVERTEGGRPAGELVHGSQIRQVILPPAGELPEGAEATGTCVAVRFVTYARGNTGHVDLSLSNGDTTTTRRIDVADIDDWSSQEVCLDQLASASGPGRLGEPLSVTVSGVDGTAGSAVSVLVGGPSAAGGSSGPGAVVTVPDAHGRLVTRSVGPLDVEVTLRYEPRTAIFSRTIDRVALLLPWLLLGVGTVLVGVDRRVDRTLRAGDRVSVPSGRAQRILRSSPPEPADPA